MCTARILMEVLHCLFPSKPGRISPMSFLVCTQPRLKTSFPGLTTSILPNNHFLSHFATPALSLSRSCCDIAETNAHQHLIAKAALPPAARKPSNPPRATMLTLSRTTEGPRQRQPCRSTGLPAVSAPPDPPGIAPESSHRI